MKLQLIPSKRPWTFTTPQNITWKSCAKTELEITCKLNDYIYAFSENVKVMFDKKEFEKVVDFMDRTIMTYDVLVKFNEKKIDKNAYSRYGNFMKIFSDFKSHVISDYDTYIVKF